MWRFVVLHNPPSSKPSIIITFFHGHGLKKLNFKVNAIDTQTVDLGHLDQERQNVQSTIIPQLFYPTSFQMFSTNDQNV